MNRILSSLLTAAFVVSLTGAAGAMSSMKGHSMMGSHMGMMHKCAKGKTWVHGYMKKDGTKVKGYCRA